MQLPRSALTVSLLIAAACGQEILAPEDLPPELQARQITDDSWHWLAREAFSYPVPPGYEESPGQPIDSDALNHVRGDDNLHHDFGFYSGRWTQQAHHPVSDVREAWVMLGGRPAQLVSYRLDGRYVVRAWWESVERTEFGDHHLVVRGESDTREARDELLSVIHSVRFH